MLKNSSSRKNNLIDLYNMKQRINRPPQFERTKILFFNAISKI